MTIEDKKRAAIVAEALSWEMTPYHPHGCVKGVGVDCAMLPAAVYYKTGFIPKLSPDYANQWMYHRDEELYLAEIRKWAREVKRKELKPGDLVVWKFGRVYSHSAIVIDPPIVLHAVIRGRAVLRADMDMDEELRDRPRKYFSVFGRVGD